jgi:hypothetical protein
VGSSITVPSGIAVANTVRLLSEASYFHTPSLGYAMTGSMIMQDCLYATPGSRTAIARTPWRRRGALTLCTCAGIDYGLARPHHALDPE